MTSFDKSATNRTTNGQPQGRLPLKTSLRHPLALAIGVTAIAISSAAYAAAPSAVDDSRTIPVNSSITLNLIANDFDSDGDAIAVTSVGTSSNASIKLNSDGSVFYTPNRG